MFRMRILPHTVWHCDPQRQAPHEKVHEQRRPRTDLVGNAERRLRYWVKEKELFVERSYPQLSLKDAREGTDKYVERTTRRRTLRAVER